jgi:hypothetical protein
MNRILDKHWDYDDRFQGLSLPMVTGFITMLYIIGIFGGIYKQKKLYIVVSLFLSIAWSFNFLFFHNFQLYQKLGILELV